MAAAPLPEEEEEECCALPVFVCVCGCLVKEQTTALQARHSLLFLLLHLFSSWPLQGSEGRG